ncbi:MAG: sulfite exporter TauE/SafE family protein [Phycisphaerales bacterium]|nr:sulfite exporter TauE/SafE family protein [Phycisphaerales bacterium]
MTLAADALLPPGGIAVWLLLPAVGLAAGALGGALGIGGGLIIIPVLLLTQPDLFGVGSLHVFKLAALITTVVVSVPAAIRHRRARVLTPELLRSAIPAALVGAIGGVLLASLFSGPQTRILQQIFGVFLLLVVASNVALGRLMSRNAANPHIAETPANPRSWRHGLLVGGPAGLIGGLLGVGGGVWAVPLQYLGLRMPLRTAIANSAMLIVFVGLASVPAQAWAVWRMPELSVAAGIALAVWIAPGAVLGGWFGAALTHRLPVEWLRAGFHVLLAASGLRLLIG